MAAPSSAELKVKTLQGKLWTISVDQADTIAVVKKKLEDKEAGPVEAQRLIFGGKILEDGKSVAEYELTKGDNPAPLFLVINPEAAKKAEDAKKKAAEEAKRAADAAKAAAPAKEDPAEASKKIEAISKKLGGAKSIHELVQLMEKELAALKPQPKVVPPKPAGPAVEWTCPACTAINAAKNAKCDMCDTANPNAPKGAGGGGPWVCVSCTYNNGAANRRCQMCDTPNPANPPAAAPRQPFRAPPVDDGDGGNGDF